MFARCSRLSGKRAATSWTSSMNPNTESSVGSLTQKATRSSCGSRLLDSKADHTPSYRLLNMTVYGRLETWEVSPASSRNNGENTSANPTPSVSVDAPSPNGPGLQLDAPSIEAHAT